MLTSPGLIRINNKILELCVFVHFSIGIRIVISHLAKYCASVIMETQFKLYC